MIINQISQLGGANKALSPLIQPINTPTVLNGVNNAYKLGALLKDPGYSQVGNTLESGKSVTGLFDFHQNPTTQKILATINNSGGTNLTLKYNNAGTWTDITLTSAWDGYEDAKVEMESFIGYCFFVGYDSTDNVFLPVGSLTGTTFSTSTNVTSMPQGKFIKRYRDRLYVAHAYTGGTLYEYRVYFSSVPSSGAITWTPATDFLDVDFGEAISGMGTNWDRLIVFTENKAYLYDQSIWKQVWDTGCSAHRTIQNKGPYMYWGDYDNFWRSSGGQPEPIGGPIVDFIKAGTPRNFFATIVDEEYRVFIGTVTVDGVTYTNCELIFNIPTQTWRWREYLSDTPTIYAQYSDSGNIRQYIGLADGEVMNKGKYTDSSLVSSDDGKDIAVNFELAPLWLSSDKWKRIKKVIAVADRAQSLNLYARVVDRNSRILTPYKPLGQLTKYVNEFDVNVDKGFMIQIAGSESSQNPYFSFLGLLFDAEEYSSNPKNANS